MEQWTIDTLHYSYLVHFLHPLSLTWEPRKFLYYSLGSARGQVFLEEVNELLGKGTLKIVHELVLAFYIRFFLMKKTMCVCVCVRPGINPLPFNSCVVRSRVQDRDSHVITNPF